MLRTTRGASPAATSSLRLSDDLAATAVTDEHQVSDPAPAIRFRPRVRSVVHLPGGRSPESLRPAGNLTAWGLRLLRSAPAEAGTPVDLTLRHADGGGQLVRAKVAGCLPAFGT